MTEEQILNAIADACEDDTLRFQIIIQNSTLHIYINRPTQAKLDYPQLQQRICAAVIKLYLAKFPKIWLYCRILGEVEPDWQSVLEIKVNSLIEHEDEMASMMDSITTAVDATNSIVSKIEHELEIAEYFFAEDFTSELEELPTTADDNQEAINLNETELVKDSEQRDFNKYCFIRNKRLLYAVLVAPPENIAQLIDTFDQFDISTQRSQLPILETYFEQLINPELDNFEPEIQSWWNNIKKLDSDNRHILAIWLSRYCLDIKQTISTIKEVLTAQAAVDQTKAEFKQQSTSFSPKSNSDSQKSLNRLKLQKNGSPKKRSRFLKTLILLIDKLLNIIRTK